MAYRQFQPNFSKGEIAPELYGRFDVDAWQAGLKKARNVMVLKYGGITKRPGTFYVAEVLDDSEPTRLIPFQFSLTQTYALELGQGYMAPCAFGGRVVETELAITAISAAANAQVTAAYHGYSVGDVVFLLGIDGEMGDLLNGKYWTVQSVVDTNNFTIDADTTGLTFTSATGGETRTSAPAPDPTPPTVPTPTPEPTPPQTYPGGGGSWDPDRQVP